MLIFSMAVVSPFVISFFLKDLYHCWSLQPPLFFISLYTLYTALPKPTQRDRQGEFPEGLPGSTLERGRREEKRQELERPSPLLARGRASQPNEGRLMA